MAEYHIVFSSSCFSRLHLNEATCFLEGYGIHFFYPIILLICILVVLSYISFANIHKFICILCMNTRFFRVFKHYFYLSACFSLNWADEMRCKALLPQIWRRAEASWFCVNTPHSRTLRAWTKSPLKETAPLCLRSVGGKDGGCSWASAGLLTVRNHSHFL